jgi:hypothetical protein
LLFFSLRVLFHYCLPSSPCSPSFAKSLPVPISNSCWWQVLC